MQAQLDRQRVAILIPAHCKPKVLKLSVGTWLEIYDGSYDAEIRIGIHSNYGHYCDRVDDILSMAERSAGAISVHYVNEIDWGQFGILRYSRMHAESMVMLLSSIQESSFTHVAMLDHDLRFKSDFIKWAMGRGADWVFSLFDDAWNARFVGTAMGRIMFVPKPSVYHMVFNRKMFDFLIRDFRVIYPVQCENTMLDTFSQVYNLAKTTWGLMLDVRTMAEISAMVDHLWSLSFNFGLMEARSKTGSEEDAVRLHEKKVSDAESEYDRRFPDGIDHLLEKISGVCCLCSDACDRSGVASSPVGTLRVWDGRRVG